MALGVASERGKPSICALLLSSSHFRVVTSVKPVALRFPVNP